MKKLKGLRVAVGHPRGSEQVARSLLGTKVEAGGGPALGAIG